MSSARNDGNSVQPFRIVFLGFLMLILVLAFFLSRTTYIVPEERVVEERVFVIKFSVTYENRNSEREVWNLTEDDMALGLFMNNSWQTVYLVNISYPIERFELDKEGNPTAIISLNRSEIWPGESLSYEVSYRAILKPRSIPKVSEEDSGSLDHIPEDLINLYCGPGGPWQVNDSRLIDLAYKVVGNETRVLSIVKNFIVWIKENIRYETGEVPRYPNETLRAGVGDCDDQANLLITLLRIVDIPAYLQTGCIYIPNRSSEASYWGGHLVSKLTNIGWHGWAMVYVPPWGWLPVDLTYVRSDLRTHPLNAINGSALIAHPTVQYANIARTDYVADTFLNPREFLIAHDFYVYGNDVMTEENVQGGKARARIGFHPRPIVLFLFLGCFSSVDLRVRRYLFFALWRTLINESPIQ